MAITRPAPVLPEPGQESAWAYPRPAIAQPTPRRLRVVFGGRVIAETSRGIRVLETSHPPTYYFPPDDVARAFLQSVDGTSICEWKGGARYFDVVAGEARAARAAWCYPHPAPAFRALREYIAFYADAMDSCSVDGEPARAQEGGFYGGWITSHVVGPFKGGPGTGMW